MDVIGASYEPEIARALKEDVWSEFGRRILLKAVHWSPAESLDAVEELAKARETDKCEHLSFDQIVFFGLMRDGAHEGTDTALELQRVKRVLGLRLIRNVEALQKFIANGET